MYSIIDDDLPCMNYDVQKSIKIGYNFENQFSCSNVLHKHHFEGNNVCSQSLKRIQESTPA
jgi:hypothetical protein